jgi:putative transposase
MQVIGLPFHIIRNGRAAARRLAAKTATRRRYAVHRWRGAIAAGLSAAQAARAVGVPRPTLYRWEKKPRPESRRPHRRGRRWTAELARAVEDLRNDNPMWGKRKIAVLLRREGVVGSVSTVGRTLAHRVKRGAIVAVPVLRRRPAAKRIRLRAKERYARS